MHSRDQQASALIRIGPKKEQEKLGIEAFVLQNSTDLNFSLSLFRSTSQPPPPPRKKNRSTLLLGYLVSVDAYMNLQLASTQEFIDGKLAGDLGEVLIRCNNVLYVRGAPDDGGGGGGGGDDKS